MTAAVTLASMGNGPAFSAYQSTGTSVASAVNTLITFNTEEFDTNNNFSSNRFTPTVAGYYQINAAVYISALATTSYIYPIIYKNGTVYKLGTVLVSSPTAALDIQVTVSSLVNANGSTDYFEIYLYQSSGSTRTTNVGMSITYFNGAMVRGA